MIEPEAATRWRGQAAFDRTAAVLIGIVAVLAAMLAIQQTHAGLAGTHAQVQAGRLAADVSARVAASSITGSATLVAQQDALVIGMEAVSRQLQGTIAGDEAAVAVGAAEQAAADRINAAIAESAATAAGEPLDAYAADLVSSTNRDLVGLVDEQNRQVDVATANGGRELLAVLGLSLGTLAGVLAGIAAVVGRGRTGWLLLLTGWSVAAAAAVVVAAGLL
jgi:hypothetical protein